MRIFKFVIITLFLFTLFYSNASCEKHKDENSDDLGNLDESLTEETKKYSIMVSESENGKVETDKAEVSAGQFVIFTILPNVGYECECLIINDKEVEIAENKYILFDVREDINVSAIFKLSKIKISYFDDTGTILLYQITSETLPCEAPFKNGVPSKKIDDKYYYVFEGWYTEKVGGEKVEDFIFTKSTKLYAHFTKEEYSVSLEKDIEMNLFESKKIDISTTLDIPYTVKYKSSNKNILEVSQDGIIKAIADGNAEVIVEIAGVEHVCTVKVVCDEVLFKAQYVYGNGYVKYEGNTGIIYTSQATIVDQQNIPVLHKYVDYSLDMYFESETTGNFGLVVNKKIDSNGAASSSIQFNFETGKTNNVKLIVDSKTIADTIKTYSFEIGKAYNFRIVTAPDAIGKVRVICYINGESIIDVVTDEPSGEGMQCGIRMAAAVTNRFSNIKVLENIIEYDVDVNETINGKVFVDKTKVIRDGALQLSVQANEGYYLETLIVNVNDITALLSDNTYTINNVLEDINISTKEYQMDLNSLLEVYYYDIQNQKTKEEVLSLNSELYTITFELENGTYCEYQNGKIIIKNNAPTTFNDKLIIKVKGNTSWKNYVKGSAAVYLDVLEIDINYVDKTTHTHKESDWNIVKNPTCTELGIKEIKCTECQEVLKTENIDKIEHNYVDGICTMCNSSDPNVNTQELKYTLKDDHYVVTGLGTCTDTVITILSIYKGLPVTEIGNFAFMNDDLTSITIPSSITKIGWQAFINCKKLKKVIFEDNSNLKTIDDKAFEGCVGLTSITIPMSVETIGEDSFYNCGSMEEVIFEENSKLLTIGKKAFSSCSKIVELDLPKSLINIEGYAFWSCGNLERITLPNGLIKIGFNAFESCTKLTEIIIPSSVTKVESYAFINCSSITIYCEVATCPNTWSSSWNTDNYLVVWNYNGEVHTHSESSWYVTKEATCTEEGVKVISCTSCGEILKTDVVEIISHNFVNSVCTMCGVMLENSLEFEVNANPSTCRVVGIGSWMDSNVVIPSEYNGMKVTSIYDNAFKGCTDIVSVTIPGTVKTIYGSAFEDCISLREVIIENGLTNIENSAFSNCVNLGSIFIPNSVKYISNWAFYNCTNLKELKFGEYSQLTLIASSAFDSCISLAEIYIPNSVKTINDSAFYGCESLFKVVIPSSVTLIEDDAFKNCSNLTIYCKAQSLPSGWETNWNPDNREVIWGYTG